MDRMLRGITVRQFTEWRAYADLEPFDQTRSDARAASIVQAIRNTALSRAKGSRSMTIKDCMLSFSNSEAPLTEQQKLEQTRRTLDLVMVLYGPNGTKQARA